MTYTSRLGLGVALMAFSSAASSQILETHQTSNAWFTEAQSRLDQITNQVDTRTETAKNVILFVGDGMGISTLTASRIYQGQLDGNPGEEGYLSFETFPHTALVKTYNVDAQTPDSAGTMTAMMSGLKTDVGVLGVSSDVTRGNCASSKGHEVITALELAEIKGLSTGIVSTARITHATPAATYAKSADRNWEDISDMDIDNNPERAACEDIASQLVNFERNLEVRYPGIDVDGIEVVMGGGRRHFLPKDAAFNSADTVSEIEGDRTDARDLTQEWQDQYENGVYIMDKTGFNAIDPDATDRVFGLFNESHMQYSADISHDIAGEPTIAEMTEKAIGILDNDPDGFFLMVEAGRIDHAHHAGNAAGALSDTIAFAKAVQTALDNTDPTDTLILVTADHGHVFTIAGYPKRGNPILGKVIGVGSTTPAKAADGLPYTTLGYMNGQGFANLGTETDSDAIYTSGGTIGRQDLTTIDTQTPGYHQEALIPMSAETHSGEDIALHAMGPSAHLAQGTIEQSLIFHIINNALGLLD